MVKCAATNARREDCGAEAAGDSQWCVFHDPSDDGRRRHKEMSAKGGRVGKDAPADLHFDLSSPEAILRTLEAIGRAVAEGRLDRSRGNALSYIAATGTQVHKTLRHEKRLREVEQRLGLREPDEAGE